MSALKLVIAEKPSVAQAISKVLGATKKEDGYFFNDKYIISWCIGHLAELADATVYDEKYANWRYEDLPILPEKWRLAVSEKKRKQFKILSGLMRDKRVTSLVCATDAGREGELIFRYVYELAGCAKPFERLWISSMEDAAIKEGFARLKDGKEYDNLYASALCRSKADWLVGINATRLFSVLYGATLNIGRVQTPTLDNNWNQLTEETAKTLWNDAVNELPEFRTNNLHLIGGTVLPVWDKLPTENVRIYRVLTSDGDLLIGRVIPESMIDATLYKLGATREKEKIPTEDLLKGIKNGDTVFLDNGWRITQKKVSNEQRIEVIGPDYLHSDLLTKKGVFTERIAFQTRYFIPAEKDTIRILDEVTKISPVSRVENSNEKAAVKSYPSVTEQKQPERESAKREKPSILDSLKTLSQGGMTKPAARPEKAKEQCL